MGFKKNIVRILLLSLWIALGCSVLVLLGAAIDIKNHKSCKGIDIEIMGVKDIFFLDKSDIMKIVAGDGVTRPEGMSITSFNLQRLESTLEKNIWVKDAELFFDNNLLLHINIMEKEPVARVFANNGTSFYIDSSGGVMPLNDKMNVKLPVFTGFPANTKRLSDKDSSLLHQMKQITGYIRNDKFWLAQIAQVDINEDGRFEMIPTIGNHIIEFGDGENYESKFRRLMIFYKQVLSHTGLNTYSKISVQYDKQVIGTRKGMVTKVDSVQALKNIQRMIEEARTISEDSLFALTDRNMSAALAADSMIMDSKIDSLDVVQPRAGDENVAAPAVKARPAPAVKLVKKAVPKKSEDKPVKSVAPKTKAIDVQQKAKPVNTQPQPKALMPRSNR